MLRPRGSFVPRRCGWTFRGRRLRFASTTSPGYSDSFAAHNIVWRLAGLPGSASYWSSLQGIVVKPTELSECPCTEMLRLCSIPKARRGRFLNFTRDNLQQAEAAPMANYARRELRSSYDRRRDVVRRAASEDQSPQGGIELDWRRSTRSRI